MRIFYIFLVLIAFTFVVLLKQNDEDQPIILKEEAKPTSVTTDKKTSNKETKSSEKPTQSKNNLSPSKSDKPKVLVKAEKLPKDIESLKNLLLESRIDQVTRQSIEQQLIESNSTEVDDNVSAMISTGVVDLGLPEAKRAPGAIESLKSSIRVAAARNMKSEIPKIINVAQHPEAELDVQLEVVKALGQLDSNDSRNFLKTFKPTDDFLKGQLLISRAMLKDSQVFSESLIALKSQDDDVQEAALNAIMLSINDQNQYAFYDKVADVREFNHMTLAMTLRSIDTPESITQLEKLSQSHGAPFTTILAEITKQ